MIAVVLRSRVILFFIFFLSVFLPKGFTQTPVTTWHYDNARTGVNAREMILTPHNVNTANFGKLFTRPLDGAVVGQALYLPDVPIPGKGTHNVVYVATMHDSVFAFDADNSKGSNAQPLWHRSFLVNGATPVPISLQGCQPTTKWTDRHRVNAGH